MLERASAYVDKNHDDSFFAPINPRNLKLGLCVPDSCTVDEIEQNVLNIT